MPRLNLVQYAKHRNVYPRAVEAAIAAGRIRRDEDGLIDSDQADIDWASNTSPHRSDAGKANGKRGQEIRKALAGSPAAAAPAAAGNASAAPVVDMGAYARSRAEREHWAAETAKLNFLERQGKLVPAAQWKAAETEFMKTFGAALLAIPDRISDELAATTEPGKVRAMLESELRSVIDQACQSRDTRRIGNG